MKKMNLGAIPLLFILFFCGCGSHIVTESAVTSSLATAPIVTPDHTPKPTPLPTPTPEPTRTPMPTPDSEKLNRQIQDFLNEDGDYALKSPFISQLCVQYEFDGTVYNLGIFSCGDGISTLQGWLFDYIEKGNDLLLVVGFDGRNGKRFVTVLDLPMDFYKDFGFWVINMDNWRKSTTYRNLSKEYTIDGVEEYLDKKKDKPLMFHFQVGPPEGELAALIDEQLDEKLSDIISFNLERAPLAYSLTAKCTKNGGNYKFKNNGVDIIEINSIEEVYTLNPSELPIFDGITGMFERKAGN